MSDKELIARGAQCVTGDLILKNKVVGKYRNGAFFISDDGLAELEIDDVVVKEVAGAPTKATRASKAKAVEKPTKDEPADLATAPDAGLLGNLDDLLGDTE